MRILLVEDDRRSREFLAKGLTEEGYTADVAEDGEAGLQQALERDYDLMILDVMMPRRDGWSVLTELRNRGNTVPVLFLTARDLVRDRVKGLELGADDYLVKPFAWAEFIARIKTLLRRGPSRQTEVLRLADLEIDLPKMKARRGGKVIDLTAKEFQLLSLLARRTGDVLSRATLAQQVWDMNFTADSNAVDVAMGRLRRKVDEPFPKKLIHTVRGLGYIMEERPNA
ncbi:MAG TPA: heavy metal response regulator transcription factor [Verrucomicrobiales bacterium]|jgi:two-component system copper resistance phosphate regulon response regulator CusR|nr:heavy metal response regulator transcription factor [Verrucomicrobiales bacterium]